MFLSTDANLLNFLFQKGLDRTSILFEYDGMW